MYEAEKKKSEERFLKDVLCHEMHIIRDEGVNRHIRFKRRDEMAYYFDIVTWPGVLVISGDCGTWVFSRTEDMFGFFRTKKSDWNYSKDGLSINPGYWSEKLLAVDSNGSKRNSAPMEYSQDIFEAAIRRRIDDWFAQYEEPSQKMLTFKEELIEDVENNVLCAETEESAHRAAADYHFNYTDDDGDSCTFRFEDFWETNLRDWSYGFIWNIFAIAWAIQKYDEHHAPKEMPLTSIRQ